MINSLSYISRIPWIVKELDSADVSVETYLQFVMSQVLRIC